MTSTSTPSSIATETVSAGSLASHPHRRGRRGSVPLPPRAIPGDVRRRKGRAGAARRSHRPRARRRRDGRSPGRLAGARRGRCRAGVGRRASHPQRRGGVAPRRGQGARRLLVRGAAHRGGAGAALVVDRAGRLRSVPDAPDDDRGQRPSSQISTPARTERADRRRSRARVEAAPGCSGKHLGGSYLWSPARVDVEIACSKGENVRRPMAIRRVRDWKESPFVRINFQRAALAGHDLLRAFSLSLVLRSRDEETEVTTAE